MRILLDANILISAALFPNSIVSKVLDFIIINHSIVICQYTIEEIEIVFQKKFPQRIDGFYSFLEALDFELVTLDFKNLDNYPSLRDKKDTPLLACAIDSTVDILLTGDKDFFGIDIKSPKILNPREFFEEYIFPKKF